MEGDGFYNRGTREEIAIRSKRCRDQAAKLEKDCKKEVRMRLFLEK